MSIAPQIRFWQLLLLALSALSLEAQMTTTETSTETSGTATSSTETSMTETSSTETSSTETASSETSTTASSTGTSTGSSSTSRTAGFACLGEYATFEAGFGNCSGYAPQSEYNFYYCEEDSDFDSQLIAQQVCPECGLCYLMNTTTETSTTSLHSTTHSVTAEQAATTVERTVGTSISDSSMGLSTTSSAAGGEDATSGSPAVCFSVLGPALLATLALGSY